MYLKVILYSVKSYCTSILIRHTTSAGKMVTYCVSSLNSKTLSCSGTARRGD